MSVQKLQSTDSGLDDFDDAELEQLYTWIDSIPLSRPKKNIGRDFSDGVLVAEIVQYYFPKLIQMHNYTTASSSSQKKENWLLLNRYRRLHCSLCLCMVSGAVANFTSPGIPHHYNYIRIKLLFLSTHQPVCKKINVCCNFY
uniref:CH-like domain-containing protein n=1 Tax=Magallana gigas TaxID=29159 RepID=A0A8W8J1T8_MAGGI